MFSYLQALFPGYKCFHATDLSCELQMKWFQVEDPSQGNISYGLLMRRHTGGKKEKVGELRTFNFLFKKGGDILGNM